MAVSAKEEAEKGGSVVLEAMQAITASSKRIAEISAASSEQAQGIEQVNKAITQMDSVTQQTAAQTEELSSTAQMLAAQAEKLSAQVAQFKIDQDAVSHTTAISGQPGREGADTRAGEWRRRQRPVARR